MTRRGLGDYSKAKPRNSLAQFTLSIGYTTAVEDIKQDHRYQKKKKPPWKLIATQSKGCYLRCNERELARITIMNARYN